LKQLAEEYRVSYPTLRIRLDKVIEKIRLSGQNKKNNFEVVIMQMVIDGKINLENAKEILTKYKENNHD
jgi:hypothetical protein